MPRKPPPPHPRGAPRTPGSGRKRGTPNRKTVELRELMTALTGDIDYQQRLRRAFISRRVHPTTEARIWEYTIGRPKEQIEVSTMDARIAAERDLFLTLSVEQMAEIAADNDALINKLRAMVDANARGTSMLVDSSSPVASVEEANEPAEECAAPALGTNGTKPSRVDRDRLACGRGQDDV